MSSPIRLNTNSINTEALKKVQADFKKKFGHKIALARLANTAIARGIKGARQQYHLDD